LGKRAETFSQVASGIQGIFVCVAALIGAWWAVHTYFLQHPEHYEQGWEVVRVPLSARISASQLSDAGKERLVAVRVSLSHGSHLAQVVTLKGNALRAERVGQVLSQRSNSQKTYEAAPIVINESGTVTPMPTVTVPKGLEASVLFLLRLPEAGVYLVQFDPCRSVVSTTSCPVQDYVSVK
jgi:hypothetical protein